MTRHRAGLAVNIGLAAAALVLAFAIPEAILRFARPRIARDLFNTAGEHLPGLREMAAETERWAKAHGIHQPANFIESSDLLWSLIPGYDAKIVRIPWVEGEKRTWRLVVNARGLRGAPIADPKPAGELRVLSLGDSIIFGDKLNQGDTIPERLAEILQRDHPGRTVEVINAGVPGYSSRQGLALWRRHLRDLEPDIVTIAFGFNDQWPSAVSDASAFAPDAPVVGPAIGLLRRTETYRTLRAVLLALRRRLALDALPPTGGLPPRTRVSLPQTQANIRAITREARAAGAKVVIANTALGKEVIRGALVHAARAEGALFVDAVAALDGARAERQEALAAKLALTGRCPHPPGAKAGILLRVVLPSTIPSEGDLLARVFGDIPPSVASLRDDGRGCDERAGDGVWSGFLAAPAGAVVHYVYGMTRPIGSERGEFDGFPWAWRTRVAGPLGEGWKPMAASYDRGEPIDTWNRLDLMSEEIHPDAEGAVVMARAIAAAIEDALARKAGAAP